MNLKLFSMALLIVLTGVLTSGTCEAQTRPPAPTVGILAMLTVNADRSRQDIEK